MLSLREIFPRKEFSETWPTNGLKNSKAPLSSHFTNLRSIIKIMIFKSASKRAIFLSRMWHTCQSHFQPTIWKPTCRSSYLCHKFNLTASLQGFQLGSLKKKKRKTKKTWKRMKVSVQMRWANAILQEIYTYCVLFRLHDDQEPARPSVGLKKKALKKSLEWHKNAWFCRLRGCGRWAPGATSGALLREEDRGGRRVDPWHYSDNPISFT